MKKMKKRNIYNIGIIVFVLGVLVWGPAVGVGLALPEPEQVVSGSADLTYPDASTLKIDASDKAIINYKSFDIAQNESVIINLPGADKEILNRVTGNTASSILGRLTANGIFMLVNPNGINIGKSAAIDAAGFLASTRDISNANFLDSKYVFNKMSKEQLDSLLLNQGSINISSGGFSALIAGAVENQGTIVAPLGTIALASGDMVTLDISGNNLVSIAIDQATASTIYDQSGKPITDQLKNSGTLKADGGLVLLKAEAASDIFNKSINLEGYVQAVKLENQNGTIKILTQREVVMNATLLATAVVIGEPEEAVPEDVTVKGGSITAEEGGIVILAKNDLQTEADLTAAGDIQLFADYDGDKLGEFTQSAGTIYAKGEADVYIDGSGTMTLGTIKTEEGEIKIGTQRAPDAIAGNPAFVHTQGDIEISKIEQAANVAILETERGDVLRYNPQGNLTLEATAGEIGMETEFAIPAASLRLVAQGIEANSQAQTTEIYKNTGDINLTSAVLKDNLVTLTGEALKLTYIKANNLTLQTDNSVNVTPGVIIPANQVKVIAKQFGTNDTPLSIQANLTYIQRTQGSIEIMQSLGLGTSILVRGPPTGGFGAFSYEKS